MDPCYFALAKFGNAVKSTLKAQKVVNLKQQELQEAERILLFATLEEKEALQVLVDLIRQEENEKEAAEEKGSIEAAEAYKAYVGSK